MIMTIDIKKLRDAALQAKSAAEQYANGEINQTEFSRQCSEFNSLTDSPDQTLTLLDELEGSTAHVVLLKISLSQVMREADEKDAGIAELQSRLVAADKLQDSAYRDGLKAGFSYGQTNDQEGFKRCLTAYSGHNTREVK